MAVGAEFEGVRKLLGQQNLLLLLRVEAKEAGGGGLRWVGSAEICPVGARGSALSSSTP